MELNLNELERRAKSAGGQEWTLTIDATGDAFLSAENSEYVAEVGAVGEDGIVSDYGKFIAAANPAVVLELVRRLREAEARVAAAAMAAYGEACKGTHPALSAEISAEYPQFFPRWPNHAAAMTDRVFHEARGIMGTENYGQEEALRMAILHVMRAYSGSKGD